MNILVTGSSGHLGEALCRVLAGSEHDVVGIDIKPSPFTTHVGSITDRTIVDGWFGNVDAVIHTATLHKPHVGTHSKQDFVATNVSGTLNLLESAVANGVKLFVFTSTTSTFGDAMKPVANRPAVWVDEQTRAIPKNIYGATKTAAEDLCQLFYRNHQLPCLILKTSRFFPEDDDDGRTRQLYSSDNSKANEMLHRRVDIQDAVDAHLLALRKAESIGFGKYIISATTPFAREQLVELNRDAVAVIRNIYPQFDSLYRAMGWKMFPQIARVYDNRKAREELGWNPKFDFAHVLRCLARQQDYRSELAIEIGKKGYHEQEFVDGPYPVGH